MSRSERKMEHIRYALETIQGNSAGFNDLKFIHQSLPDLGVNDVRLDCKLGELSLSSPVFINAMTGGGGEQTLSINRSLSKAAKMTGIAMAVGSQMSAIKNPSERKTYEIVREENPEGIIIANLGSEASVADAKEAVSMIGASALQIHLNVIQELTMPEGDRDFSGALKRISAICEGINVPLIVKEVGFGMSRETVRKLTSVGVSIIDVGGSGGTNFAAIENQRRMNALPFFNDWGIPTPISIMEAAVTSPQVSIIGSGGIKTALDAVKCLSIGAHAVGLAGYFLKILVDEGLDQLILAIESIQAEMMYIMTALGASDLNKLRDIPIMISGDTFHWLSQRGIDIRQFSQR